MLSRSDLILKYIVEYFIKTATPVGSNTLLENYDLPFSSATIRNEMAHLESLGFIEKTHTSSGRVPSSKGYRYYVKNLRDEKQDVDEQLKHQLALILDKRSKSIEDVLKESCKILSHMTNLASVVLGPSADEEHLASIQLIPLSSNSATCVFVTDKGYVENKTFIFEDEDYSLSDVKKCVDLINERTKGTAISQLVDKMDAIKPVLQTMIHSNDAIYRAFAEAFLKFTSDRIAFYGKENLLDQPEFNSDISKLKKMLEFIDSPEKLRNVIDFDESLGVHIGKDEQGNGLEDVSFVTKKISIGKDHEGTITLVGPTRMDYDKIVNALEYLAEKIDELYNDDSSRKEPN